jgi:hypothetical protein
MPEVTRSAGEASIRRLATERSAAAAVGLCEHCYAQTTARSPYWDRPRYNRCDGPGLEPIRGALRQRGLMIEVNTEFTKPLGNRNATARKFSKNATATSPYWDRPRFNICDDSGMEQKRLRRLMIEVTKEFMKVLGNRNATARKSSKKLGLEKFESWIMEVD